MNIFYLHSNPKICAEMHCDKHVVKMILEYGQLLSTAHRVLDGTKQDKIYVLTDSVANNLLYKATHINHPSAIWTRKSLQNYNWLCCLLKNLCQEYTYRYDKIHKVERSGLLNWLITNKPKNICDSAFTEPTPAMPDYVKVENDSLTSYRQYYIKEKRHIAVWKNRQLPEWYL